MQIFSVLEKIGSIMDCVAFTNTNTNAREVGIVRELIEVRIETVIWLQTVQKRRISY
jgi:hypothetical protein